MRNFKKLLIASIAITCCASAYAQFDLLKNLGNGLGKHAEAAKNLIEQTKEIDEPQEIALGQEFAATLLGAKPLWNDAGAQRYVNNLGRWLTLQTERPDLPWTFGVLDDDGFNAFATPGGNIFVTRGLLARMHNESELVGVLSHEIAHVLRKHYLAALKTKGFLGFGADLIVNNYAKGNLAEYKEMALKAAKEVYSKGLDKSDEYEADRVAVVIAARAGYDPYGLPAVLQTLQSKSSQDSNFSLLFETHPSPNDRIDSLDKAMRSRFGSGNWIAGKTIEERLKEFSR
ncbi:MAG: M48 family metalloprotease [Burkholderiales bacterium]|nr:M48 family metalloprotease [Burkholderiales bacterium]MBI3731028.1 M48 family metalloprotease [Burkholderiales bacterium]